MDLHLIQRIVKWNMDRYKQVYHHKLTCGLLQEELDELKDSSDAIEVIDALVDIIYVATGALWKLGLKPHHIYEAIAIICKSNETKKVEKVDSSIKANKDKGSTYIPPTEDLKKLWQKVTEK